MHREDIQSPHRKKSLHPARIYVGDILSLLANSANQHTTVQPFD